MDMGISSLYRLDTSILIVNETFANFTGSGGGLAKLFQFSVMPQV